MNIRCVKKPINNPYDFKLYIAYESKSKKLICHSDCLKDMNLYLSTHDSEYCDIKDAKSSSDTILDKSAYS